MGSISSSDLQNVLQNYPDDYEVIMKIRTKQNHHFGTGSQESIAFINGVKVNDEFREIYLLN